MMQELNRVADIPDADQRAAELVKVRNSDPSTFNGKKQLHPDTAAVTKQMRISATRSLPPGADSEGSGL